MKASANCVKQAFMLTVMVQYNFDPSPLTLHAITVCQHKQTGRQLRRSLVLHWRTCLSCSNPPPQLPPPSHSSLLPSILPDSGDSSYSFGFSLRTWNASTFQFSPARQRQRTLVRSPACIQFHLDLKAGSLDMLVEFQSVWSSWRWKVRIAALQCKRRLKKISCTLPELWQRTHSTLLILHLFSCGPLF